MKLTQTDLNKVEEMAELIEQSAEEQRQRLNGNGAFVGESPTNVFKALDNIERIAPRNQIRRLRANLQRAENALQMVEMLAEQLYEWAEDQN